MDQVMPKEVVIKDMTCTRSVDYVYDFMQDVRNWETGGILKSITRSENDSWWTCDTPIGKAQIYCEPNKECRILDHVFVAGNIKWNVYVRVIPNGTGSTTSWTFLRPEGLDKGQFEEQLKGFDSEFVGWKKALENI
jgi:hypothetical protein